MMIVRRCGRGYRGTRGLPLGTTSSARYFVAIICRAPWRAAAVLPRLFDFPLMLIYLQVTPVGDSICNFGITVNRHVVPNKQRLPELASTDGQEDRIKLRATSVDQFGE